MSINRKLKRAQRFHVDRKCPECGNRLKYHKELRLFNTEEKAIKPKTTVHKDVFWCNKCKSVYGLPDRKA